MFFCSSGITVANLKAKDDGQGDQQSDDRMKLGSESNMQRH